MTLRPKVYLLLLIILVLLNISLAVLIRDAKHMNQRDEFTRDSNERVALFNQFTETLESEVDENKNSKLVDKFIEEVGDLEWPV